MRNSFYAWQTDQRYQLYLYRRQLRTTKMKVQSITIATATTIAAFSLTLATAALEACPTRSACKEAATLAGIDTTTHFYPDRDGVFPFKGCYTKTNSAGEGKAFWSQGTTDEMESILTHPKMRLWCQTNYNSRDSRDFDGTDENSSDYYWESGELKVDLSGQPSGKNDGMKFGNDGSANSASLMGISLSVGVVALTALVASL